MYRYSQLRLFFVGGITEMEILSTGRCSFSGSYVVDEFCDTCQNRLINDNLSTGKINSINSKPELYKFAIDSPYLSFKTKRFIPVNKCDFGIS